MNEHDNRTSRADGSSARTAIARAGEASELGALRAENARLSKTIVQLSAMLADINERLARGGE